MKIGIEVEFFGTVNDELVNMTKAGIPSDEYPLLAEARGLASDGVGCVYQAVGSVRAEIDRICTMLATKGIKPVFENWMAKNDKLDEQILRDGLHKRISYQNLNGKSPSKKNKRFIAAGLHVSFTKQNSFSYQNKDGQNKSFEFNQVFDYPLIFNRITAEFLKEIKEAGRVEGFYEVKPDGRVEYRSLPANIIHRADFAERLNKAING